MLDDNSLRISLQLTFLLLWRSFGIWRAAIYRLKQRQLRFFTIFVAPILKLHFSGLLYSIRRTSETPLMRDESLSVIDHHYISDFTFDEEKPVSILGWDNSPQKHRESFTISNQKKPHLILVTYCLQPALNLTFWPAP